MTDRRDSEKNLVEGEDNFRQLVESLPELLWTCTPEGVCSYLSPQWIEYTGISEAAQLNFGWTEQIHPDDRAAILTAWSVAVRLGDRFQFDYRIRRFDGEYHWFEARAVGLRNYEHKVVKWFGSSKDIHEARQTQHALELEKRRLADLVALAPAVFFVYALQPNGSGCFPYASPAIADLYGIPPDVLKNDASHLFALIHPDSATRFSADIEASAKILSPWISEFKILHPLKGERWIEGRATPSLEPDGVTTWHGFLSDITERKRFEADQQFLFDLGAQLQSSAGPEAIAKIAAIRLGRHFGASRCSLSAIDLSLNETTLIYEGGPAVPPPPLGPHPLSNWGHPRIFDLLSSGATVAVANTATDPLTADFYPTAYQPLGIAALLVVPLLREGSWVAAIALASSEPRTWSSREIEVGRAAAERIWPSYEAARASAAEREMHQSLIDKDTRLRLALASAAIGIWEVDHKTRAIEWDERAKAIFGYPSDLKLNPAMPMSQIHPEDRLAIRRAADAFIDPHGKGQFASEYRILSWRDGSIRHIYGQGQTVFEGEGENRRPVRSVGTLQDITERKTSELNLRRSLDEKQALLQEVHHRVNNNLQIISSLLSMQASAIGDKHAIAKLVDSERRVKSMAMIHERLYKQDDMSSIDMAEYITDLAGELFSLAGGDPSITYRLEVAPLQIPIEQGIPCGLILNELITNALRYAYPAGNGEVVISLSFEDDLVCLSVSDSGVGLDVDFDRMTSESLGMTLVRMLTQQLDGQLAIATSPGASFIVRFPLTNAASQH